MKRLFLRGRRAGGSEIEASGSDVKISLAPPEPEVEVVFENSQPTVEIPDGINIFVEDDVFNKGEDLLSKTKSGALKHSTCLSNGKAVTFEHRNGFIGETLVVQRLKTYLEKGTPDPNDLFFDKMTLYGKSTTEEALELSLIRYITGEGVAAKPTEFRLRIGAKVGVPEDFSVSEQQHAADGLELRKVVIPVFMSTAEPRPSFKN